MGCARLASVATELALGVLTGPSAEALAHPDRCEACRENVRQLTMTGEELLELLPASEPAPGFETGVLETDRTFRPRLRDSQPDQPGPPPLPAAWPPARQARS